MITLPNSYLLKNQSLGEFIEEKRKKYILYICIFSIIAQKRGNKG